MRCTLKISFGFSLVMLFITWLILGSGSPLEPFFLEHVGIPNFFRRLLTIPYVVMMVLRPNTLTGLLSYVLVFVQWLVVGALISFFYCGVL